MKTQTLKKTFQGQKIPDCKNKIPDCKNKLELRDFVCSKYKKPLVFCCGGYGNLLNHTNSAIVSNINDECLHYIKQRLEGDCKNECSE